MATKYRRFVTGHRRGKSVFLKGGRTPNIQHRPGGTVIHEMWATRRTPASNDANKDGAPKGFRLMPPKRGSIFRIIELTPDSKRYRAAGSRPDHAVHGRHPRFHKTATIDYAIVLEGEVHALMDVGERKMKAGDVLIQRGTSHAWANRSRKTCVIAFVLIDADPA